MKKIENHWESHLSNLIPYITWGGLAPNERTRWATPRHSNTCYELHIVLAGSCCLNFDAETFSMAPGNAVLIAPGVYHAPQTTANPFCRFSITFSAVPELDATLDAVNRDGHLFFEPGQRIIMLCNDIIQTLDGDSFLSEELSSAYFSTLMVLCLQNIHAKNTCSTIEEKKLSQEDEIELIDRFFARSIHDHPSRKKLAQYLHCSERQLNRKIKTLYGITFQQKLLNSRMDLACYLLRSTTHTINDISSMIGYSDTASFFHTFQQHIGCTPMMYRNKYKNKTQ